MTYKLAKEHKRHYGFVKKQISSSWPAYWLLHLLRYFFFLLSELPLALASKEILRWRLLKVGVNVILVLMYHQYQWYHWCWHQICIIDIIWNCFRACDVGPWGTWTSCYVPPNTCGWGYKNRTRKVKITLNEESHILLFFCRDKIQDAKHNGEKCAKLRIIEISEIINCNVPCELPGKV